MLAESQAFFGSRAYLGFGFLFPKHPITPFLFFKEKFGGDFLQVLAGSILEHADLDVLMPLEVSGKLKTNPLFLSSIMVILRCLVNATSSRVYSFERPPTRHVKGRRPRDRPPYPAASGRGYKDARAVERASHLRGQWLLCATFAYT